MAQESQTFDPISGLKVGDKVKPLRSDYCPSEFWWGKDCEVVKILDDGLATVKLLNFPFHKETIWPCRYLLPHWENPIGKALLDVFPGIPKECLNIILAFNFGYPVPMPMLVPECPLEVLRRHILRTITGHRIRVRVFAMTDLLMDDQVHNQAELAQAAQYTTFPHFQRKNFRLFQRLGLVNVPAPGRYIITEKGKTIFSPLRDQYY